MTCDNGQIVAVSSDEETPEQIDRKYQLNSSVPSGVAAHGLSAVFILSASTLLRRSLFAALVSVVVADDSEARAFCASVRPTQRVATSEGLPNTDIPCESALEVGEYEGPRTVTDDLLDDIVQQLQAPRVETNLAFLAGPLVGMTSRFQSRPTMLLVQGCPHNRLRRSQLALLIPECKNGWLIAKPTGTGGNSHTRWIKLLFDWGTDLYTDTCMSAAKC